jgi:hypothetical protein
VLARSVKLREKRRRQRVMVPHRHGPERAIQPMTDYRATAALAVRIAVVLRDERANQVLVVRRAHGPERLPKRLATERPGAPLDRLQPRTGDRRVVPVANDEGIDEGEPVRRVDRAQRVVQILTTPHADAAVVFHEERARAIEDVLLEPAGNSPHRRLGERALPPEDRAAR